MPENLSFPATGAIPFVKICGLTRVEDALLALELGASFLGLILTTQSKRHLPEAAAARLLAEVRECWAGPVRAVGVFVDESPAEIAGLLTRLDLFCVQVHGPVPAGVNPGRVIPAMAIRDGADGDRLAGALARHPAVLADAFVEGQHGGTGKVFDHRHVQPHFAAGRVFIAGGLGPGNIGSVVGGLSGGALPYAFDLSSGVEASPGVKSHDLMRQFFAAYHRSMGAC